SFAALFASPRNTSCPALPRTAFGARPSATVTLAGAAFVGCWTIPAGQAAAHEWYGFRRTAGTGVVRLSVFDGQGRRKCDRREPDAGFVLCPQDTGPLTVIVEGSTATGTFQVFRRDAGAAAAGCRPVASTAIGGPAIAGMSAVRGDAQCHRVPAHTLDRFLIDTRDTRGSTRVLITDQTGASVGCHGHIAACPVKSGGTTYQVLVHDTAETGTTPYRLDVWKTSVAGRAPAECTVVANTGYGFGPFTGTFNEARMGLCVLSTVASFDDFDIEVLNGNKPGEGKDLSFHLWGISQRSTRLCGNGSPCYLEVYTGTEPVLFVLSPGERVGDIPYRLEATCTVQLCGFHTFGATGLSPATLTSGGKRTLTVRGSTLHLKDTVQVAVAGRPAVTATVKSVSTDRSTLTAEVDLTSAPAGRATVTIRSFHAGSEPVRLADAFTVTPPALRATRAPSITGTRVVGQTVRVSAGGWTPAATSYTYQWSANGAAIKGATGASYLIPATALGRKLTVTVTARRGGHPNGAATSAAATVARGKAPRASAAPKVTGTAKVGRTVKVAVGTWSPKATSYRYEWRLNGSVVRGATGSSLRLTAAMRNKRLTVTVIARRAGHTDGKATSKPVTVRR
ncbi:MAG TPA: hypothetical protein VF657_16120, partial [Actinoplanes sp.]